MLRARLVHLYILNATLLVAHEIDSAYWHEWELFGLPGGIQLFVVLNAILVALVLVGLQAVALARPAGAVFSWLLVAGGLFAVCIHSWYLHAGNAAFRLPVSLALLCAIPIASALQGAATVKYKGPRQERTV